MTPSAAGRGDRSEQQAPKTHVDGGNAAWRAVWAGAYWFARRQAPVVRFLVGRRVPGIRGNLIELSSVGRRSGDPRTVFVTPIRVDGQLYVGSPRGPSGWLADIVASDGATATVPGGEPTRYRAVPLEVGPERERVIRAAARQQLLHVRPLYLASRRHLLRTAVYCRLEAIA